jgi:hypothetical protein
LFRKLVGLEDEAEVLVRVDCGRIVVEPIPRDLEEMVGEWVKTVLNIEAEPFSEETWKWMSEEYAKRKLGLIPDVVVDVGIVVVSLFKTPTGGRG